MPCNGRIPGSRGAGGYSGEFFLKTGVAATTLASTDEATAASSWPAPRPKFDVGSFLVTTYALNALKLVPERVATVILRGGRLFSRWRTRRETYMRLMALDDRLLQDIGLTRADVWSATNGDFHKTPANTNTSTWDAA